MQFPSSFVGFGFDLSSMPGETATSSNAQALAEYVSAEFDMSGKLHMAPADFEGGEDTRNCKKSQSSRSLPTEDALPREHSGMEGSRRPRRRGGRRTRNKHEKGDLASSGCSGPTHVGLQPKADSVTLHSPPQEQEDPLQIGEHEECCKSVCERLESESSTHTTLAWLLPAVRALALSRWGSRVVQKAIEVADSEYRNKLLAELQDHVVELYESPHGNHVVQVILSKLPGAKHSAILSALEKRGWVEVAKHQYGCRVVERVMEHSPARDISPLIGQVLEEVGNLSEHCYGNFPVQHLLEHYSQYGNVVVDCLLARVSELSMHKHGSHVVQAMLRHCDQTNRHRICHALIQQDLLQVAKHKFGHFVLEEVAELTDDVSLGIRQVLSEGLVELLEGPHGCRVAEKFQLQPQQFA
eukprot:TRINITY_DN29533_c0_g1_i1.p1 TRINITY_DN29533_c0_g1~~TRINITY_DN29533_c0_g1_i1.p1  ORF type:complete len:461 (+),score=80.16 TRINITY_DN29533_c0_g1_i1:148-1383(+)